MSVLRPGEHPDELISSSLTGDLSGAEQAALDGHLAGCARCRQTLAAFGEERRLISGMRHVPPPRDLGARVRAGIDGGRSGSLPWWRRTSMLLTGTAVLGTVAAGLLAVVVLSNPREPVAQESAGPSTSASAEIEPSAEPSASIAATPEPLPTATVNPQAWIRPGELGYFSMTGNRQERQDLTFKKEEDGKQVRAETPPGAAPIAAAVSPDGEWVAYITGLNLAGYNQVWALHLTGGATVRLGCSQPHPFTDRLIWSWDSAYLAYTLAAVDPGPSAKCGGGPVGEPGTTDVWIFRPETGEPYALTSSGDAFAADTSGADAEGGTSLLVSHAAADPWSEYVRLPEPLDPETPNPRIDGVFMPQLSPRNVRHAIWWTGEMQRFEDGRWIFARAGMPQVGTLEGDAPFGEPLFEDLSTANGDGFETGNVVWGSDGDLIGFWGGQWTGAEQGEGYPDPRDVYAGRLTEGGLTRSSRLSLDLDEEHGDVVSVVFRPDGVTAIVTITLAPVGDLDPRQADVVLAPLGGGPPSDVPGVEHAPWDGPFVYGPEPKLGPGAGPDDY
jgi:hypothetical protein